MASIASINITNHNIRKDTSMPIRAGVFFDMFPFCILFEVWLFVLRIRLNSSNVCLERHDD